MIAKTARPTGGTNVVIAMHAHRHDTSPTLYSALIPSFDPHHKHFTAQSPFTKVSITITFNLIGMINLSALIQGAKDVLGKFHLWK